MEEARMSRPEGDESSVISNVSHETSDSGRPSLVSDVSHETIESAYIQYVNQTWKNGRHVLPAESFQAGVLWGMAWMVSHETLQDRARAYRKSQRDRDQLVRDLKSAGWKKVWIHQETGIGRATIDRILGAKYPQNHGHGYVTAPREKDENL